MNKFLLIVTLLTTFLLSEQIQNIQVNQRTDGSGILDITYDLIDETFPSFTVLVELSIDNGEFTSYTSNLLSGDFGENVIPGSGKSIQLELPSDTYSTNVIVKIIASAYMVTSELPFTMIGISSSVGVSSYQGQSIDYNYEIMQNELTNADLVTFLETYEFQLNEDNEPIYNCNNFTEYFLSETDQFIEGCMDSDALNYNPNANQDLNNNCIYPNEVGCTDISQAHNYNPEAEYNNGVCELLLISSVPQLWDGQESCDWTSAGANFDYTLNIGWFDINQNQTLEDDESFELNPNGPTIHNEENEFRERLFTSYCPDPNALNYTSYYTDFITNLTQTMPDGCLNNPESPDTYDYETDPNETQLCVYTAIDWFLGDYTYNGNQDYGYENIENFQTQAISFEGSSFVIGSGAGTQPALLNYDNCVDGVILGLMLEHYGLRIPNGEEWIKASRQDNDRCWPWMAENCSASQESFCSSQYTCMTQEEYNQCEESLEEMQLNCQITCNSINSTCMQSCEGGSGDGNDTDCGSFLYYDSCQNTDGCDWDEDTNFCVDSCYDCMGNTENSSCYNDPCNGDCECCSVCDSSGGDSFDWDCNTECNNTMMTCMNDCGNTYNNPWEYCNGQDMTDCISTLEDCTHYSNGCESINSDVLLEILNGTNIPEESNYDRYGFLSYIFNNKFNLIYDESYEDGDTINLQDISQYPNGISPFGLYDVIGNAPEIVKFDNQYWLVGLYSNQGSAVSFCADDIMFTEENAGLLTTSWSLIPSYYGLRLARTTISE